MDARIQQILTSVAELPDTFDVKPEHDLRVDLDIDSLRLIDVVLAVEDEFGVELEEEALAKLTTVAELVSEVERSTAS